MRTKTQKNFHKEMKRYQKKRKKLNYREPISYIYKNENYYEPSRVKSSFSFIFRFIIRLAIIVGILSYTGIVDQFIKKETPEMRHSNLSQSFIGSPHQIIYNYLDQYEPYENQAKEIIDRYNSGKLELIEVYALQKVLMESVTFTKNPVDELLFDVNEAIIQYHEQLMNWLEVLGTSDPNKINMEILNLQNQQKNLFAELTRLFDQVNIPYQILDDRIIYERVNH